MDGIKAAMEKEGSLIEDPRSLPFPPAPHVQRMINEEADLHEKHRALSTFLSLNPVAKTLSKTDLKLMIRQRKAMATYLDVLNERIRRAV